MGKKQILDLTEEHALRIATILVQDLMNVSEEIAERRARENGLDQKDVKTLLTQTYLTILISTYFSNGRSLEDLLEPLRMGWKVAEAIKAAEAARGPQG